jgi:hypothetical protein
MVIRLEEGALDMLDKVRAEVFAANQAPECSAELFEFAAVHGREVVGSFDLGAITSDAGVGRLFQ